MEPTKAEAGMVVNDRAARLRRDLVPHFALAAALVCAAGSWSLLKELGSATPSSDPGGVPGLHEPATLTAPRAEGSMRVSYSIEHGL